MKKQTIGMCGDEVPRERVSSEQSGGASDGSRARESLEKAGSGEVDVQQMLMAYVPEESAEIIIYPEGPIELDFEEARNLVLSGNPKIREKCLLFPYGPAPDLIAFFKNEGGWHDMYFKLENEEDMFLYGQSYAISNRDAITAVELEKLAILEKSVLGDLVNKSNSLLLDRKNCIWPGDARCFYYDIYKDSGGKFQQIGSLQLGLLEESGRAQRKRISKP